MWYLHHPCRFGTVLVRERLAKLCKELFKEFHNRVVVVIVKIGSNALLTNKNRHTMLEVVLRCCLTTKSKSSLLALNMPYEDVF